LWNDGQAKHPTGASLSWRRNGSFTSAVIPRKSRGFERRREVSNFAPRRPAIDPIETFGGTARRLAEQANIGLTLLEKGTEDGRLVNDKFSQTDIMTAISYPGGALLVLPSTPSPLWRPTPEAFDGSASRRAWGAR
jgi:hypothetical protein